jgi:hypothetical protein
MHDMRELLEIAKQDAPPGRLGVDDIVAAGRRRKRRRVAAQWLSGVAVVAVVAAAALTVRGSSTNVTVVGESAPKSPPFTFTFTGYQSGDYRVEAPNQVTPGYQTAIVRHDHVKLSDDNSESSLDAGSLTVYQPGVFKPDLFTGGTKVTVQGRPGWQATLSKTLLVTSRTNPTPTPETRTVPALAWQYTDGAWAVITSEVDDARYGIPAAEQLKLAAAFTTGTPVTATAPYRMTYIPSGYVLVAAGSHSLIDGDTAISELVLARAGLPFASLTGPVDLSSAVLVSVSPNETGGPYTHPFLNDKCPAGKYFCDLPVPGTRYYVEVYDPSSTLPSTELLKIAQGLVFDNVTAPDTWHPVVS